MIDLEDITTTIYCYDEETGKKKYITNFSPLSNFRYAGNDFYLIKTKMSYKVCIQVSDTDLLSVWRTDQDKTEYEAKELFKKGIDKFEIKKKDIELFITNPIEYKKRHQ